MRSHAASEAPGTAQAQLGQGKERLIRLSGGVASKRFGLEFFGVRSGVRGLVFGVRGLVLEFGVWCWSSCLGFGFPVSGCFAAHAWHASSGPDIHFSCLPCMDGSSSCGVMTSSPHGLTWTWRVALLLRVGEVWEGIFAATPCFFPDGKVVGNARWLMLFTNSRDVEM